MANYYRIRSADALLGLAIEAGLPAIEAVRDKIDGHVLWELALPADPEGLHGNSVRCETYITVMRHAGGFELTAGSRVLQVSGTREELLSALQWLTGVRPQTIRGDGVCVLAAPPPESG